MYQFSVLFFCLILSSCLLNEKTKNEEPTICGQAKADMAMPDPIYLPNLSTDPIYLEWRDGFTDNSTDLNYYSSFKILKINSEVKVFINITGTITKNENLKCSKLITMSQFEDFKDQINNAKICQSISYSSNSCNLSMISPSSIYIVNSNSHTTTVNLHPYNFESDKSFCNRSEIDLMQISILNLFQDLNFEADCNL